ncbi:hypothetical protein VIGAN_06121500 [Vigna angularis var. angularis]|uniref:Tr-type G domain-containing protein n=2 Tax=Phaseolus angularis TaxID=3914 RepID=A0A0S3SB66_PHAAN|nr:uncharacterized protein LOC108340688 [Vigna angularis]BAT90050.1 hypothetical protein VIGAN_06121500 [Vigna angularis var. angularis]
MVGPILRSLWSSTRKSFTPSSPPLSHSRFFSRAFAAAPAVDPAATTSASSIDPNRLRNVAVIAHVDHGKTTLMDRLLRQCGADIPHERAMDSISLERERGITISSKVTSVTWKENELNMVDTPGHADFGGEVERVVGMVEGAILVVDAGEGPLAQTKFVLAKALKYGLRPILLLNKVDRPSVTEETCDEVESLVFDLFANLGATEEQLDFPVLYASAKEGWASTTFTKDPPAETKNMSQLLDAVVTHVPPPNANTDAPFQMLVSMMERDFYLGRILTGRISSGVVRVGDRVHGLRNKDSGAEKIEDGKVVKLMKKKGTNMVLTDCAGAGDIISIAGLSSPSIGHTVATLEIMSALPTVELDPPTISMTFGVNDSPLAGRDGTHLTGGRIGDRLMAETETNLAINVLPGLSESFEVQGRGELQLGILIENMRREGFELSVSPPKVMYKTESGQKLEPVEEVTIEVNDEHVGLVMEALSHRRAEVTDMGPVPGTVGRTRLSLTCPSRGLVGYRSVFSSDTRGTGFMHRAFHAYEQFRGPLGNVRKGVLVSMGFGTITAHALMSLEARGTLFVNPGMETYDGMIVGEHSRDTDLDVNPVRSKELTNVRAASKDENVRLTPPRLMTLEEAIGYVASDELIEVTPKAIRLRKKYLDVNKRKAMSKRPKE